MCLSETHTHLDWAPPLVRDGADDGIDGHPRRTFSDTLDAMAAGRPSWTLRGVFKQTIGRPGMPRRLRTKINLNDYWDSLEKVVKVEVTFPAGAAHAIPASQATQAAHAAHAAHAMDVDNEVNDNLANERTEHRHQQKMEVDGEDEEEDKKVRFEEEGVIGKVDSAATTACVVVSPQRKRERVWRPNQRSGDAHRVPTASPEVRCDTLTTASRHRTPLGTINGMESRAHIKKSLSPLTAFADNLARRLTRHY